MSNDFDYSTLEHLSSLCRIRCNEEEKKELLANLEKILGYIEQLFEVDTEGVHPCSRVIAHNESPMREDIPDNLSSRADLLANAPEQIGGMIRVPSVFI